MVLIGSEMSIECSQILVHSATALHLGKAQAFAQLSSGMEELSYLPPITHYRWSNFCLCLANSSRVKRFCKLGSPSIVSTSDA